MFLGDIDLQGWLAIGFVIACIVMGSKSKSGNGRSSSKPQQ